MLRGRTRRVPVPPSGGRPVVAVAAGPAGPVPRRAVVAAAALALLTPALGAVVGSGTADVLARALPHGDAPTATTTAPAQTYAHLPLAFVRDGAAFTARTA